MKAFNNLITYLPILLFGFFIEFFRVENGAMQWGWFGGLVMVQIVEVERLKINQLYFVQQNSLLNFETIPALISIHKPFRHKFFEPFHVHSLHHQHIIQIWKKCNNFSTKKTATERKNVAKWFESRCAELSFVGFELCITLLQRMILINYRAIDFRSLSCAWTHKESASMLASIFYETIIKQHGSAR